MRRSNLLWNSAFIIFLFLLIDGAYGTLSGILNYRIQTGKSFLT